MSGTVIDPIAQVLKETVLGASRRLTVDGLVRSVRTACPATRRQVRSALASLVAAGELAYTYELGSSFVVPSVDRPVRVSHRLVLCPNNQSYAPAPEKRVVFLTPGAAFGSGAHATTRLALKGIDLALESPDPKAGDHGFAVLDIGTGSGVLVIAAVILGAGEGLGTDIDPCALSEARSNVAANGLTDRVRIENRVVQEIDQRFQLVVANLRTPTLVQLVPQMDRLLGEGGDLVVSGLREEEAPGLIRRYRQAGFACCWQEASLGWTGIWFRRDG